jgi:hypothetical protein
MNRTSLRLAAVVGGLALVTTACGSNTEDASDTPSTPASSAAATAAGAAGTKTDAAALRAGLTYLLEEHVYLAGIAISQAVKDGGDLTKPGTKAAVAALDTNSVALSKAVASAYPDAEKPFLDSWRSHIGFFVDYTLGKATKDNAKVEKAKADLNGYRTSFGQLINSVVPELPADTIAGALMPHVDSLFAAIDAVVAGDPTAFAKLKTAASHMPGTAAALAGGIDQNKKLAGETTNAGAELRAGLTALLTEHVYLAGVAINQAVADGGDLNKPATKAAVAALDANSVDISKAVGSAYPDAEKPFLDSWRSHIGFFVDYTLGKATKDNAKVEKAKADLDGYRISFGQLINSVVPELPADTVAGALMPHVDSLFTAIDAVVAGDPTAFAKLQKASTHMPDTAAALAGGIAENKKLG